jgi:hypothetical protein
MITHSRWAAGLVTTLVMAAAAQAQYTEVTPGASGVTASTNDGNAPGNAVDNNLGTRWSANGDGQWLKLDLGSTRTVGYVKIAVYSGNLRQARFDLQVSTDNSSWTNVLTGALSNGTQTTEQTFDFGDVSGRWVRYVGHGNTVNMWNSLSEVSVFAATGATPTPAPTATPTPGSVTSGWTQTSWTYTIHKPYDLNVSDRFNYTSGVWKTWVYITDNPLSSGSTTLPRSEMRWNNDYTSGNHMWDGDVYVPSGTYGVNIQQTFGGVTAATASMVRAYSPNGGELRRYSTDVLMTGIYNTWINVKAAHDANNNSIKLYVNNVLKRTDPDRGDATHYFKNGVYTQDGASNYMECRFRNLKYWKR